MSEGLWEQGGNPKGFPRFPYAIAREGQGGVIYLQAAIKAALSCSLAPLFPARRRFSFATFLLWIFVKEDL